MCSLLSYFLNFKLFNLFFQDLNRQIVKSDYATFSIPELEFEQQSMRKGGMVR